MESTGQYTIKETGEVQAYTYEFSVYDSIDEALSGLGEPKCLSLIQRMVKIDANNMAREKAKVTNGHSTRIPLTEAEKAAKKAERKANKTLLSQVKALTPEQVEALPESVRVALGY